MGKFNQFRCVSMFYKNVVDYAFGCEMIEPELRTQLRAVTSFSALASEWMELFESLKVVTLEDHDEFSKEAANELRLLIHDWFKHTFPGKIPESIPQNTIPDEEFAQLTELLLQTIKIYNASTK